MASGQSAVRAEVRPGPANVLNTEAEMSCAMDLPAGGPRRAGLERAMGVEPRQEGAEGGQSSSGPGSPSPGPEDSR